MRECHGYFLLPGELTMDRITSSLLDAFKNAQLLLSLDTPTAFEHFANYCVILSEYSDEVNLFDVWMGAESDTGLDGIAIIVNGVLVTSCEEVDDLAETNGYIEATFILVQAKTGRKFDTAEFGNFAFGVKDFFSEKPQLRRNEHVAGAATVADHIFRKASHMTKGRPNCKPFYVTCGKWEDDATFTVRMNDLKAELERMNLFDAVSVVPVDADRLQRMYNDTQNKVSTEISFQSRLALPDMDGVSEAYLGVLPITEYIRLIVDDAGNIRRNLFYDNVRDYQGDNEVNREISQTLVGPHQNHFAILNNGVTIVAKKVRTIGNRMTIEDYQIANGCQTSHVLYNNREKLNANTQIPVRVIAAEDEDVTNAVIKATNRQTPVSNDDLLSLSDFQKKLEAYYAAIDMPGRLYYERRSRQYNGMAGIEKIRIVPISLQIRCIASMFLDEPHRASRYYSTLLKQIGNRIFRSTHDPLPYYLSALANHRVEGFFRNRSLDAKYRTIKYHMLMGLRYHLGEGHLPEMSSNRIRSYCEGIVGVLRDDTAALANCQEVAGRIEAIGVDISNRDNVKTQSFTDSVKQSFPR